MDRNIALYRWFNFVQALTFWQATWFLYFESQLSAAEAILLYVVYYLSTTFLELPSGYMSDKLGRKLTLMVSALCGLAAAVMFVFSGNFFQFAVANVLLGAASAFSSGTDSSFLFESLNAEGKSDTIQAAELKAFRFSFVAMAFAAFTGGAMAAVDDVLPYVASAIAAAGLVVITAQLKEPPHAAPTHHRDDIRALLSSLTHPSLLWLLCLSLVMYVFSHIPYIFGQPFMREALSAAGYASQTPIVSGAVTATMMLTSVFASLVALRFRNAIGLPGILLVAFGLQIALTAALALSNGVFVIGLLFLRMVPDSWSQPFIRARIHPLLQDGVRAAYMSVQSLAGRVIFAITLSVASAQAPDGMSLPYSEMQTILATYAVIGITIIIGLGLTVRRAGV